MNRLQGMNQQSSNVSYLIIDDEIAANKISQEDFIDDLGFTNTNPQFVASCEEALNALRKNLEIKFCFLDCKLPRTTNESINYNPNNSSDYGIQLLDEIIEINQEIPIIVFSAYVDKTILKKQTQDNSNIVGYLRKDEAPESYREAFKLALQYCNIPVQGFEPQNSIISIKNIGFDYDELSQKDSDVIKEKTRTIKDLAKKTADSIIQIGKNLTDVKLALPKGKFYAWAESEFPWSIKMVNRFMTVYERFNNMSNDELELLSISVLYELAPKSVSDEAIKETIDIAKTGETISLAKVKEIKKKHSDPKTQPSHSFKGNSRIETSNQTSKANNNSNNASSSSNSQLWAINNKGIENEQDGYELVDDSTAPSLAPIRPTIPNTSEPQKLKQEIIKVISPQRLWNIDKHTIYNGDPNSTKFLKLLPPKASICLNFSPNLNFKFHYQEYDSWLNIHIDNPDLDNKKLVDMIDKTIGSTTNELDPVIVIYIPHPDILNIVHDWYCQAYIVDPSYEKCINLVNQGISNQDPI